MSYSIDSGSSGLPNSDYYVRASNVIGLHSFVVIRFQPVSIRHFKLTLSSVDINS